METYQQACPPLDSHEQPGIWRCFRLDLLYHTDLQPYSYKFCIHAVVVSGLQACGVLDLLG